MGVGENRDQERELKRERDYQERIVVFRAVSLGMLGLVESGHMMNTAYFYQQSKKKKKKTAEPKTCHWSLGVAIEENCNGLVKPTIVLSSGSVGNGQIMVMKLIIEQLS